jgi:predicted acetyltransferase
MLQNAIVLRLPREDEEPEFLRAHQATTPDVPTFLHDYDPALPFRRYLEMLLERERGSSLPAGHVPVSFLFAFLGDRIVGRASIRHRLTPFLERVGGHIGYVVVPEFRRRGCATEILRLSLCLARERIGLRRVLVTCDDDNIGSIRAIERNGGVLENVVTDLRLKAPKRRYWIDLGRTGATPGTTGEPA